MRCGHMRRRNPTVCEYPLPIRTWPSPVRPKAAQSPEMFERGMKWGGGGIDYICLWAGWLCFAKGQCSQDICQVVIVRLSGRVIGCAAQYNNSDNNKTVKIIMIITIIMLALSDRGVLWNFAW